MTLLPRCWRPSLAYLGFLAVVVSLTVASRPARAQADQPTAPCLQIYGTVGEEIPVTRMQASGGAGGPYTFSATGLPQGLSLSKVGDFGGSPEAPGKFEYTVTITDKSGNKGTVKCMVFVASPPEPGC